MYGHYGNTTYNGYHDYGYNPYTGTSGEKSTYDTYNSRTGISSTIHSYNGSNAYTGNEAAGYNRQFHNSETGTSGDVDRNAAYNPETGNFARGRQRIGLQPQRLERRCPAYLDRKCLWRQQRRRNHRDGDQ